MGYKIFNVNGKPIGKGRPRFWNGRAVTPPATREYEKKIREAYESAGGVLIDTEWVNVEITAYFVPPKSSTKKFQREVSEGKVAYTKKPDIDNITKIVLDGLNGVAWSDDAKVVRVEARKTYAAYEGLAVTIKWGEPS